METENRIIKIFEKNINYQKAISLETKLIDDLNVGSFDKLMIVNAIEDEFCIAVDDTDFSKIETILDIVKLVKKQNKEN
jgi:acyl carrier protein